MIVHLNRAIVARADSLAGSGHGGPAVVANAYRGHVHGVLPEVTQDVEGMQRLFRQFRSPAAVPEPRCAGDAGSDPRGRRLGYVLPHAFGAAFDNLDYRRRGGGRRKLRPGPLSTGWHGNRS